MNIRRTAIVGAGGWGTALAVLWSKRGNEITLWGHDPARTEKIRVTRENESYLPGVKLPDSIDVTSDIVKCAEADLIVFVTPSIALRSVATQLRASLSGSKVVLLSGTKGIEHGTGMRMSQILEEIFPDNTVAVISGPNLAVEVSRDLPTATVLGCSIPECAEELQRHLGSEKFRIYSSDETIGIELGGALKNVFAIPAGVSDGFGLGDNSKAALVTRSLAELLRLGTAMGGNPRTFYGLSGAGDLIATCFSRHSRNRRVGEKLGRGETLEQIRSGTHMVAEGIPTTKSAYECARKLNIDTPIIDQIYSVLYEGKRPDQALQELLGRDQKAERI
ncbi:MAG TPA: NAD(P)H-dependent glycerol-3-phosphate dehydrogenase [Chthoniobacterales bacterium]|nr:NAD(P)H-dependent glycerol-3-phosphate dehydrogenase [Chthoniobacterales bacterium]